MGRRSDLDVTVRTLFVHQNFPAQFLNAASSFAAEDGHEVVSIGSHTARALPNVRLIRYQLPGANLGSVHPFARQFDIEVRRAEQVLYIGTDLLASGFEPDIVFVHCGWGEGLPLRALFPRAKIVSYLEYFYQPKGLDVGFDPEWPGLSLDGAIALHARNAGTLLSLADADVAISPTAWQRSTFPPRLQSLISVCHEGIDVKRVRPDPAATYTLPDGRRLKAGEQIVTFVARNLEPLRGYHIFMRSLPKLMQNSPNAHILIVGGDYVSYGLPPPTGQSWKDLFWDEVKSQVDADRVHFLGRLDYDRYLEILQVSAAHVYLTYPFVLSWSLLEAMSAGCMVIGSRTGPVEEVLDDTTGALFPFFDADALASQVSDVLKRPWSFTSLREAARRRVIERFDSLRCLSTLRGLVHS